MNEKPLISVLMPAYNCERYISKSINSILSQTYSNWQLLIADDASTDSTKSIIESFDDERIIKWHNSVNLGYLKASNELFRHVTGDFVTFQDADDFSHPNRLEDLLNQFILDNELGCVGSFVKRVDEQDNEYDTINFKTDYESIKEALPLYFNCVGSSLMIRSEILKKVGLYNEFFDRIGSEDLYWFAKIALNYKTINIPKCLYFYRSTPGSVSNDTEKSIRKKASKDFASVATLYYMRNGVELFESEKAIREMENYALGKQFLWEGNYKKGYNMLLKSWINGRIMNNNKKRMLKSYFGPYIKSYLISGDKK